MTLDHFIQTMLHNRDLENTKITDFDSYKDAVGEAPERAYSNTVRDAVARYQRSRATYGTTGEALGNANLADSGYAEALLLRAKEALASEGEAAKELLQKENLTLANDYADYLEKKSEETHSRLESIVKKLASVEGVTSKAAYDYAVLNGLAHEEATVVAEMAENLWKNQRRQATLDEITNYGLRYDAAKNYAKASGFSDAEAEEIANAAESIWQEVNNRHYNHY